MASDERPNAATLRAGDFRAILERLKVDPEREREWEAREKANLEHQKARRRHDMLRKLEIALGVRYQREAVSLDCYEVYDGRQSAVLRRVREIAADISRFVVGGTTIIFLGDVGTGKDHLMANLLFCAADAGHTIAYLQGQDLFARLRETMGDEAMETEKRVICELLAPEVLAISDPLPPDGDLSLWRREVLYRLIDKRYSARRSIWMTTNVMPSEADVAFSEPVWDRLQHNAQLLYCNWGSYRKPRQR